jgi:hypothetical protein
MIEWTKIGKNDFKWTSPCGNYTLRVEKLHACNWWYDCSYKKETIISNWEIGATSEKDAKAKAEVAYIAANAMLKITKTKAHKTPRHRG